MIAAGVASSPTREGLHFARQDRFVARPVVVQALASLSVGATAALLVVLAQQPLPAAARRLRLIHPGDWRGGWRRRGGC